MGSYFHLGVHSAREHAQQKARKLELGIHLRIAEIGLLLVASCFSEEIHPLLEVYKGFKQKEREWQVQQQTKTRKNTSVPPWIINYPAEKNLRGRGWWGNQRSAGSNYESQFVEDPAEILGFIFIWTSGTDREI